MGLTQRADSEFYASETTPSPHPAPVQPLPGPRPLPRTSLMENKSKAEGNNSKIMELIFDNISSRQSV